MKWIVIVAFFTLLTNDVSAQSIRLKRKYLKEYNGEMPKYTAILGQELIEVSPSKIEVKLNKDSLSLSIGNSTYQNVYIVSKSTSPDELFLIMEREDTGIVERFILNTKKKTIIRKGVFPQPDVSLIRVKKSGKR
jgi:hypothetical protein